MMSSEIYKPSEEELALLKRWYAPDVGEEVSELRTNALGMKIADLNQPKPEPVVITEDIEPETLSEQSLQEIKQQAQEQGYQEGLIKGKEEGLLKGHEAGYEQGLEQGIEEGKSQGFELAKPDISKRVDMLEQLISAYSNPLMQQQESIEKSLLHLALTLARKIVHCEITQNTQPIIKAVSEGIRVVGGQQPVVIKLNPVDLEVIQELYNDEQQNKVNLTLEADPGITIGDCLLETSSSSVLFNIEERINQVFDDFSNQPTPSRQSTTPEGIDDSDSLSKKVESDESKLEEQVNSSATDSLNDNLNELNNE